LIWLIVILPLIGILIGVGLCFGVQRGRSELALRRAERARIERQVYWAERRLHDIAQQALGSMLDEARRASPGNRDRSA
jgi:hypothetical protein